MTGTEDIIGGHLGYAKTFIPDYTPSDYNEKSDKYRISDVYFKLYPSCRHTHATIEAAIALHDKYHLAPEDIEEIIIHTNSHAAQISIPNPTTYIAARFSQQYAVSVALLTGTAMVQQFTDEYTTLPLVKQMIQKVKIEVDEKLEKQWPEKWSSIVEIRDIKGTSYKKYIEDPKGGILYPIKIDEIIGKVKGLLVPQLGEKKTEQVITMCMNLEDISDINDIAVLVTR